MTLHRSRGVAGLASREIPSSREVRQQMAGALDRTCHEQRNDGNRRHELQGIGDRGQAAAGDVDRVGEFLERVEAEPRREDDLQRGRAQFYIEQREVVDQRGHEEVVVLEEAQDAEIDDETDRQEQSALVILAQRPQSQAHAEVDDGAEQQEPEKPPVPPAVEEVARDEDPGVPRTDRMAPQQQVHRERDGQERERTRRN
jgi:hypothetical protein